MGDYPDFGIAKDIFQIGKLGEQVYAISKASESVPGNSEYKLVDVSGKGALLGFVVRIVSTASSPSGYLHKFNIIIDDHPLQAENYLNPTMLYNYYRIQDPVLQLPFCTYHSDTDGEWTFAWAFATPLRYTESLIILYKNGESATSFLDFLVIYTKE